MAFHRRMGAVASAAVALAVLAAGEQARGQALGEASGFTEFIFGNSQRHGDTTGAVAVGGNADFASQGSFTVENSAKVTNTLVVGGTLTGQYGTIGANDHSGNIYIGGNLNFSDPTIYGNTFVKGDTHLSNYGTTHGNLTYQGSLTNPNTGISGSTAHASVTLPIHFSTDQTMLSLLSMAQYKASDPTVAYDPGGGNHLTFAASGPGTSYFNVGGSNLAGSYGITFSGTASETIVINVTGTADSLPNVGYTLAGGLTVNHVLFNFYQATSLAIGSGKGSILAPFADVTFNSGSLDGEIIARSLTGGGETHVYQGGGSSGQLTPFMGDLRPVPEPASLALMAIGGLGLVGYARHRRRAARPA